MDPQIVFNDVTDHLARQKAPALGADGWCALRGVNGTKCAIGCLIPNSEYFADMEYRSTVYMDSTSELNKWLKSSFAATPDQYELLKELQVCHDLASRYGQVDSYATLMESAKNKWPTKLDSIAKRFGLVFDRHAFEKNFNNPDYAYSKEHLS